MKDVSIDCLKLNGDYFINYTLFLINIFIFYIFSSGSGCSLKRYCTNKQFQNKQFKKTNIIKTANKGYGICAIEDIPKYINIIYYKSSLI